MTAKELIKLLESVPGDFEVMGMLENNYDGSYRTFDLQECDTDFSEKLILLELK